MTVRPDIIAHRGASGHCHENTMAAFERAVADGADGIEFDLRVTADGHWVVHHDPVIPIAESVVRIDKLTLREVKMLWAGPHRDPIPSLTEFLEWAGRQPISLVFDIKDSIKIDRLVASVHEANIPNSCVYSAFRKSVVREIRRLEPEWKTARIVGDPRWRLVRRMMSGPLVRLAQDERLSALHLHERWITPSIIEDAGNRSLRLVVWTVDDPIRMRLLSELGVDAVITNRPGLAREILGADDTNS